MLLTDTALRKAKARPKRYTLADGLGLFLLVDPGGGRWWRFRYRFDGKEKNLSLGKYPEVSLETARDHRNEARKQVAAGIDPAEARRQEKAKDSHTFEAVAREWLRKFSRDWTEKHRDTILARLERHIFPWIGRVPIAEMKAKQLLAAIRAVEGSGAHITAHKALANCGQVFRYAIAAGLAEYDLSAGLRGALTPAKGKHHASVTDPKQVGGLLRALDSYQGHFTTRCALRLAPLVFVRPGELRRAEWAEIDLDGTEWRIPAHKMKARRPHIVPLSRQAVAVLRELHPLTGHGKYVFPSIRTAGRPMSENTVTASLRRLGFSREEMTGHGFRSMASTILHEQGWPSDVVERQLAHAERNQVKAAYNYAEHLPERRRMMQAWADYLDGLRAGAKIIPMHRAAALE